MATMLEEIGKAHGVAPKTVFESLGRNRAGVDLAMNLPFVLIYLFAAVVAARRLRNRYPPEDGWMPGLAMVLLCSIAFGVGGVLLGEQWSTLAETIRIGNGHLSYRLDRVPWVRYQTELFGSAVVVFWFVAAALYRTRYTPPT